MYFLIGLQGCLQGRLKYIMCHRIHNELKNITVFVQNVSE